MTLEWIDPPRDYRDDAAELAAQLHNRPGTWARVERGVRGVGVAFGEHRVASALEGLGIETRFATTDGIPGTYGEIGDLYARAPKEAE